MPNNLTLFAAQYLVFIDAAGAAGAIVLLLYRQPRPRWIRWTMAILVTLVVAYILAQIGAALYNDPRPFTEDHVKPLIPHAADNGFPSDHGLLVAAIVAAVLLVDFRFSIPFVIVGALVDWARVGAGIHHVVDVVGSAAFVAVGLLIGYVLAPAVTRMLLPYVPARFAVAQQDVDEADVPSRGM